jgi:hypothetical protein
MTEPTRRYNDGIEPTTDHDLLIRLNTKISTICMSQSDTNKHLKDFTDKIEFRCESRLKLIDKVDDKILGKSMFTWLFGIIVVIIITVFSVAGINRVEIAKYQLMVDSNAEQIKSNADTIKILISSQQKDII